MKGVVFSIELLGAIVITVITVGVLYFWFSGTGEVQPASPNPPEVECRSHSDCSSNSNGELCMSIQTSPTFCGCLDDSNCLTGRECINNICVAVV